MSYNAPEKAVVIKGERYKGLNIGGKAYAPVPRRVESAHKNGGFTMIRCDYPEIFGLKCCEVEIEVNGQRFIGTAEIKMAFGNPISDGQTSALGRALGFAGYDIETAIASAEDMESYLKSQGQIVEANADPWSTPRDLAKELGLNVDEWRDLTKAEETPERVLASLQRRLNGAGV